MKFLPLKSLQCEQNASSSVLGKTGRGVEQQVGNGWRGTMVLGDCEYVLRDPEDVSFSVLVYVLLLMNAQ